MLFQSRDRDNELKNFQDAKALRKVAVGLRSFRLGKPAIRIFHELFDDPLPETFPNLLASSRPLRGDYPFRPGLVIALFLLCFLPRAAMCLRIGDICPDGVLYVRLASALERGDYAKGFDVMNLNIYPVALMTLRKLGLDYQTAGMTLGVLTSSLVVLPLFGWIRRQFDDRIAIVACFLYASHPVFVAWSPELIRDSSYWLFFTLFLYAHWRAMTELRARHFILSGLSLCLAVLTRFEGLFLLIPFALWTYFRFQALESREDRRKAVLGATAILLTPPIIVAIINVTWLRGHSVWMISRLSPLELIDSWWRGRGGAGGGLPFHRMVQVYVPALVKGVSAIFGVLMLVGLFIYRRDWARRDNQTLFFVALTTLVAAWIHAWNAKESCDRYYVTIALMGSPFAAAALIAFVRRIVWGANWGHLPSIARLVAVAFPLAVIAVSGPTIAMKNDCEARVAQKNLANWVLDRCGSNAVLCGSEGVTPVVAFHTGGKFEVFEKGTDDAAKLELIRGLRPDVIFMQAIRHKKKIISDSLLQQMLNEGYLPVERSSLPGGVDEGLLVLATKIRKSS